MVRKPNQRCIMQELGKQDIYCTGWCKYCNKMAKRTPEYKLMMRKRKQISIDTEMKNKMKWCKNTISKHKDRDYEFYITPTDLFIIAKPVKKCKLCNKKLDWSSQTPLTEDDATLHIVDKERPEMIWRNQIICRSCNCRLH